MFGGGGPPGGFSPFQQGGSGPSGSQSAPSGHRPPPLGTVLTGTVKSYSAKGFGFILCGDVDHDVYFARESLQDGLRTANIAGTVVQFVLQRGLHGKPQAVCLRPLDGQIAPMSYNRGYTPEPGKSASSCGGCGCGACGGCGPCGPCGPCGACGACGACGSCGCGGGGGAAFGRVPGIGAFGGPPPATPPFAHFPAPQAPGPNFLMPRAPVAPPKRLSPHAGSRAIAGMKAQEAARAAQSEKSSAKSSSASPEPSSESSSSEKKKKKKEKKEKKEKKKGKRGSRSRSRRKSKSSSSRLSVSSSSPNDKGAEAPSSEVQQAVENAKREVLQQLENLKKLEPKEQRMKEWRSLLRSWHPDKNPDKAEVATAVFQFLQKGKLLLGL